MIPLPSDVARCGGQALIDRETAHIYVDPSCEGCHRLIAARTDTAAWIEAGRPTQGDRDRTPDTRCVWMSAPDLRTQPCPSRIDDEHQPAAVAEDRRAQEKARPVAPDLASPRPEPLSLQRAMTMTQDTTPSAEISGRFPAFPVSTEHPTNGHQEPYGLWQFPGMSIRDYFAAKAMQAALTGATIPGLMERDQETMQAIDKVASAIYAIADAMLKARAEGGAA